MKIEYNRQVGYNLVFLSSKYFFFIIIPRPFGMQSLCTIVLIQLHSKEDSACKYIPYPHIVSSLEQFPLLEQFPHLVRKLFSFHYIRENLMRKLYEIFKLLSIQNEQLPRQLYEEIRQVQKCHGEKRGQNLRVCDSPLNLRIFSSLKVF